MDGSAATEHGSPVDESHEKLQWCRQRDLPAQLLAQIAQRLAGEAEALPLSFLRHPRRHDAASSVGAADGLHGLACRRRHRRSARRRARPDRLHLHQRGQWRFV